MTMENLGGLKVVLTVDGKYAKIFRQRGGEEGWSIRGGI